MRLPLAMLEVFAAIAEHGSLRAAADALCLKPSTVSHQLKALEEQIGVSLFFRTTRTVTLTEAGRELLRGARPAFTQLQEAYEGAKSSGRAAKGKLKLQMPEYIYDELIGSALGAFCNRYPEIELELVVSDPVSGSLEDGMHAVLQLGEVKSKDYVALPLGATPELIIVASPEYFDKNGTPTSPEELLDHNCIRYRHPTSNLITPWPFMGLDGVYIVEVGGTLVANSQSVSLDFAQQGIGIAYTFRERCSDLISKRKLQSILKKHLPKPPGVFISFPSRFSTMVPLNLFCAHLTQTLGSQKSPG